MLRRLTPWIGLAFELLRDVPPRAMARMFTPF